MTIHLLIPMSGQGHRFQNAGYKEPKPLVPVSGAPMIERVLSFFPSQWPCHFVLSDDHQKTGLPDLLKSLKPRATQSFVASHKKGPSYAALKGLENIPDNEAVLLSYCDYGMVWDPVQFENFVNDTDCDACLLSYRGFHAHYLRKTAYAYSRLEGEQVVEVREKGNFTDNRENEFASCGAYYFKTAKLLREAIDSQLMKNLQLNGEYYTSLTVQALLEMKPESRVRVFEIDGFFQWGTPEDVKSFEYWEKTFRHTNRFSGKSGTVEQILMPMAGLGSRFSSLFTEPKPLIPVDGKPMYQQALSSLPKAATTVVVTLGKIKKQLSKTRGISFVLLPKTPEGQALSTLAGVGKLKATQEVIVSSCDHGIVLDPEKWAAFKMDPQCDAAIFTVQNYPGAERTPMSYAYVVPEWGSSAFPLVQRVSVKKTVSDQPLNDHLLVGTFWFKDAKLLKEGIELLRKKNKRVNNELYLDSIFEILKEKGVPVRMIPLNGYICWGDPDAMAESLYWQEQFCGRKTSARKRFEGGK